MTLFNNTSLFTSGQPKKEMFEPEDASLVLLFQILLPDIYYSEHPE
jgi:hypothetical protein